MKVKHVLNILILLILSTHLVFSQSSDAIKLNELLIKFKANRGDILFPEIYNNFKRILSPSDVSTASYANQSSESFYQKMSTDLNDWIKKAIKAEMFLAPALEIRDKALEVHAEDFAEESFKKAEQKLQDVALKIAEGNRNSGEKELLSLVKLYRKTYGEAVRNNLLGEVQILLQESKNLNAEKNAPRTYQLTRQLLSEVESLIDAQRYDSPQLDQKATLLKEEANHLWKITQMIHNFQKKNGNYEAYLLRLEKQLRETASLLNLNPKFSRGIIPILMDIQQAISNLKEQYQQLAQMNEKLAKENQALKEKITQFTENKRMTESLEQKLDTLREQVGNVVEIQQLDSFLILKIPDFTFNSGSLDIRPIEAQKLNKLILILREFPNRKLVVKYVQPQRGELVYNQTMALKRAQSIKNYLQAFMFLDDSLVDTIGEVSHEALPLSSARGEVEVTIYLKPYSP